MLEQFLQIAAEEDQRVIITLFDQASFAPPGTVQETDQRQYLSDIVTPLKNDDRILAWDLHNEPDNYGTWGTSNDPEEGLTWLYRMHSYLRSLDPNHLITIGVGRRTSFFQKSAEGYNVLDLSDFVSMHSYNADALAEEVYEMQQNTGRNKPIVIEETGWPTGPIFAPDFTETIQLQKYQKTLKVASDDHIAGVLQWELYDIDPIGAPPWDDIGNYYGLVRRNGTLKPAATLWQTAYTAAALPPAATVTNLPLTHRDPPKDTPHYQPQSDHSIGTPFWELWQRIGAGNMAGFPITEAFLQEDIGSGRHQSATDQGKTPIYQYFENLRLEYHPERRNDERYKTLLGLDRYFYLIEIGHVGQELAAAKGYSFAPSNQTTPNSAIYQWFDATSHSLQEPFLSFWRNHLGDRLFGAPISDPFEETNPETGQRRLVQYFQNVRLEYRPAWANTLSAVVVGNAGSELAKAKGWLTQATPDYTPTDTDTAPMQSQSASQNTPTATTDFADPAFQTVWQRTDQPVKAGTVSRTWLWGAAPFATAQEPYQQSPNGTRLVEYFDKSRMERTNPTGDRNSQGFVTNGLLVREMITGQMQIGDNQFQNAVPAQIPMAGDPASTNPSAPTYASLQHLTGSATDRTGQPTDQFLAKDGTVSAAPANLSSLTVLATYNNGHNIAEIFWQFMTNSRGPVIENGQTVTGDVVDWIFSIGLPITEPYWTKALVGGVERDVLVQAFERRILTYTPANPAAYQVEMGNVGQHYYTWKYGSNNAVSKPSGNEQPLDDTTRQELNATGGLLYREVGNITTYKYTAGAGEANNAANLPGAVANPDVPASGAGLTYVAPEQAGRLAIHLNNLNGSDTTAGYGLSAALSPDGNRLALTQYGKDDQLDLLIQSPPNGPPQVMATNIAPALSWSNDGQKLAFYYNESNQLKLAVSENGASPHILLETPPDTLAGQSTFSPDGQWLAYTLYYLQPSDRNPKIVSAEIHLVEVATGQDKVVATNAAQPVWSPDGQHLVWLGWQTAGIWEASWDGSNVGTARQLGNALPCEQECNNTGQPAFSPDSKWLVYTGPQRNLLATSTTGGPAYDLTSLKQSKPLQVPSSYEIDPVWVKHS